MLNSVRLDLYGSEQKAVLSATLAGDNMDCLLSVPAPGWVFAMEASSDLIHWIQEGSSLVAENGKALFAVDSRGQTNRSSKLQD